MRRKRVPCLPHLCSKIQSITNCRPQQLDEFLMNEEYTFAESTIEGHKKWLKLSNLESNSNNYIDIQVEWREPYTKKEFDSLADVAGRVIDNHYTDMKNVINRKEGYTLWESCHCHISSSSTQD
ncbi:hypothetical protein ZWY2020_014788 [Hordeum vulgare]|nr:hypothetical protein ZWY2020_014788 [Hordeum vulgare]